MNAEALVCEHCCHAPTYRHREAQQQPFRGLWHALVARVANTSPDIPIYRGELDRWLVELWDEMPEARAMIAVRTTEVGREAGSLG